MIATRPVEVIPEADCTAEPGATSGDDGRGDGQRAKGDGKSG